MTTLQKPETPTLDRVAAIQDKSQAIGEFMEWLREELGYELGYREHHRIIHLDAHFQRLQERRDGGEISDHDLLERLMNVDLREMEIGDMLYSGEISPECWGMDPDCPDAGHPKHRAENYLTAQYVNVEDLIHRFFDVDRDAVERERDALFAHLREMRKAG